MSGRWVLGVRACASRQAPAYNPHPPHPRRPQVLLVVVFVHLREEGYVRAEMSVLTFLLTSVGAAALFTLSRTSLFVAVAGDLVFVKAKGLVRITSPPPSAVGMRNFTPGTETPGTSATMETPSLQESGMPTTPASRWGPVSSFLIPKLTGPRRARYHTVPHPTFGEPTQTPKVVRGAGPSTPSFSTPAPRPGRVRVESLDEDEEELAISELEVYTPLGDKGPRTTLNQWPATVFAACGLITPMEAIATLLPPPCGLSDEQTIKVTQARSASQDVRSSSHRDPLDLESPLFATVCFVQAAFGSAPQLYTLIILLGNEGFHRVVHQVRFGQAHGIVRACPPTHPPFLEVTHRRHRRPLHVPSR